MKTVRIYGKGFVKVAPIMMGGLVPFEKLIAIEWSGDVQKKTGATVLPIGHFAEILVPESACR